MVIRSMETADITAIVDMEQELFTTPWSSEDFTYEITKNVVASYYVLENDREIVGYIGFWLLGDQTQITTIGVATNHQGKGYAHILIRQCIEDTKQYHYQNISLEVRISNTKAIRLYESYDFSIVARRKQYYQDTKEDAYVMVKEMEE